ncbi:thioredoxin reductase [Candidatus Woesearchaeota archaeon]|nr:thioredoxin reductase [Candidatus Woesearchaeota archaeon]
MFLYGLCILEKWSARGMIMTDSYDLIIVGGGCVGFAAAMYAGRMQLRTAIFAEQRGGTIILTDVVENYPGFKKLTGTELAEKIIEHAKEYDIEIFDEKVASVEKVGNCYRVSSRNQSLIAKTVLFATGTIWRKLGVPGEEEYANKGVHYCALCDGAFYKDKVVGVVGGSDSAAKEALLLTQWAKKVYIIYRKENIRAEPINTKRVAENKKIEIIPNTNVVEIKGGKFMNRAILDKPYNGSTEFSLDALFIEIGHIALSDLAKNLGVACNQKGEIVTNRAAETNLPGIYAAGDVGDAPFKQAITGVGEGVAAVFSAFEYVNNNTFDCPKDEKEEQE